MEIYSREKSVKVYYLNDDQILAESWLEDLEHHLRIRLYFSLSQNRIEKAELDHLHFPWIECPTAEKVLARLNGMELGPGLRKRIEKAVGGPDGCPHVADLVVEAVKGVIQANFRVTMNDMGPHERVGKVIQELKGSCVAFAHPEHTPTPRGTWAYRKGILP